MFQNSDRLDARVSLITVTSSAIVGIVMAAKFIPEHASKTLTFESLLLGAVCVCSLIIYRNAAKAWMANVKTMPGSLDAQELHDELIDQSDEMCYTVALMDRSAATQSSLEVNGMKGAAVNSMLLAFQCQLGFLAAAVAWSGLAGAWEVLRACCCG